MARYTLSATRTGYARAAKSRRRFPELADNLDEALEDARHLARCIDSEVLILDERNQVVATYARSWPPAGS